MRSSCIHNRRRIGSIAGLALFLVWFAAVGTPQAAGLANARAMGMAGSYMSLAKGADCPAFNPANLGLDAFQQNGLQLFGLGFSLSNNSFSLNDYNTYTGASLDENDKDELLGKIPAEGLKATADIEATAVGVSLGNLAISFSAIGAAEINLGRAPMELLLHGNTMADTIVFDGMYGEGYGLASANVSYGKRLYKNNDRQLAVGGTVRYLQGLGYEEVTELNGRAATLATGFEGEGCLTARTATGGSGYSVDLGSTLRLSKSYTVGVMVYNAVSHMRWDQETKEHRYTFAFDTLTLAIMDADSLITSTDTTIPIGAFATTLPAMIRVGLAHTTGKLLWAVDWEQGFKRGAGTSATPRVSAGAEYRLIHSLPLRAGFGTGGRTGTTYAGGLGFDFSLVYLDIAVGNYSAASAASGKGLSVGVQSGIRF